MVTDDQLRVAMASAMKGFASAVASIESHQWELPSPCDGWSVSDVVEHVFAGEHFTVAVLGGSPLDEAVAATRVELAADVSDRLGQLTTASAVALAAFDGSLDRTIEHRVGVISARRMLGFRIIDELGHTWDLATAVGEAVVLDPGALAIGLEVAHAERTILEQSPNFATLPDEEVATSDPQIAFLRAIGRASEA